MKDINKDSIMSILLASTDFWEDMDVWSKSLRSAMPEIDIRVILMMEVLMRLNLQWSGNILVVY